jgi:outer membrane autotransporter protein
VSTTDIDVSQWGAGLHAGFRARSAHATWTPMVGVDWIRQRHDGWSETGGIALRSDGYSASRRSAWVGLEASRRWEFGDGRALELAATARVHSVVGGTERIVPVAFVDEPDDALAVTGVPEPGNGASLGLAAAWQVSRHVSLQAGAQAWRAGDDRGERFVAALRVDW